MRYLMARENCNYELNEGYKTIFELTLLLNTSESRICNKIAQCCCLKQNTVLFLVALITSHGFGDCSADKSIC